MAVRLNRAPKEGSKTSLGAIKFISFDELADKLLAHIKIKGAKRTHRVAIAPINHLRKTFHGKKAALVKDYMFWEMHVPRAREENPKRNLNQDRKLFIQILNYGFSVGVCARPPGKIATPNLPSDVGREFTDTELRLLLKNAVTKNLKFQIEIAIVTGMRKTEILSIKYDYCDLEKKIIFLPKEITKTRKGRAIPIPIDLAEKIYQTKLNSKSAFLFPNKYNKNSPQVDNKRAWQRTKKISGVNGRFHDLRHTAATRKLRSGASIHLVSMVLGMGVKVLTSIYQHLTVEDLRATAVSGGIEFLK